MAQPAAILAYVPVNRHGSDLFVGRGSRYRATVSASKNYDKATIAHHLAGHGWSGVALWEPTDALPADWPAGEDLSGLEDNHRWLRGEAVRTGDSTALGASSPWPLTIYRIANLWQATAPSPSVAAPGSDLPRLGPGLGPGGLDANMPEQLGAAVYDTWSFATDPAQLRALAATMRMGGYPIAANVLDQQALYLEAEQPAPPRSVGRPKALQAIGTMATLFISMIVAARE